MEHYYTVPYIQAVVGTVTLVLIAVGGPLGTALGIELAALGAVTIVIASFVVLLHLPTVVAFYYDAQTLAERDGWSPTWWLYSLVGLVVPVLPAVVYIVQRHRHTGEPTFGLG